MMVYSPADMATEDILLHPAVISDENCHLKNTEQMDYKSWSNRALSSEKKPGRDHNNHTHPIAKPYPYLLTLLPLQLLAILRQFGVAKIPMM